MPKDVVPSVRDGLAEIAMSTTRAMSAPDAGPLLPMLGQFHQQVIGLMQRMGQQQMGQPGGPPGQPGPQQPMPGQAPGPPAQGMPNAGGQGVMPSSPQPNKDELAALLSGRAGM